MAGLEQNLVVMAMGGGAASGNAHMSQTQGNLGAYIDLNLNNHLGSRSHTLGC